MRNQCAIRMYTSETLEDGIKSGSRPAEKNNHKKHTFEYVKNQFFGRTKGGALLKRKKKEKTKKRREGSKNEKKETKKRREGLKTQSKKTQTASTKKKKMKSSWEG